MTDLKESYALVELDDKKLQVIDLSHPKGTKVVVAVRSNNLTINKQESSTINQMEGTILRRQFIHGFMRYEIELTNGKIIVAEQPYKKEYSFNEKDKVFVSFLPEHTLVFSHPGGSLEEILEI